MTNKQRLEEIESTLSNAYSFDSCEDEIDWLISRVRTLTAALEYTDLVFSRDYPRSSAGDHVREALKEGES